MWYPVVQKSEQLICKLPKLQRISFSFPKEFNHVIQSAYSRERISFSSIESLATADSTPSLLPFFPNITSLSTTCAPRLRNFWLIDEHLPYLKACFEQVVHPEALKYLRIDSAWALEVLDGE